MRPLLRVLAAVCLSVACSGAEPALDASAPPADARADAPPPDVAPTRVTAMTTAGPVVGLARGPVTTFRRIPFAAPPVGALRFAAPAPVTPWTAPLDATGPGSVCAQGASLLGLGGAMGTEDCLHVNVHTPALTGARPVMVWIHGGGFATGSGSETSYEGSTLASAGDVVVVTINYRLGVLGFLSHPALASTTASSGNWGFLDQQAALRWVRDNAARFGGDPAKVTLFGESAGGTAVSLHVTAPGSRGLFARAIVQSGPPPRLPPRASADAIGAIVATAVGCTTGDVAACLRQSPTAALQGAVMSSSEPGGIFYQTRGFVYLPTFDGVTFPLQPIAALRMGMGSDTPMILGTNTDEGSIFHGELIGTPVRTEAEYQAALRRAVNVLGITEAQAAMIAERYPASRFSSPNAALQAVTTEGLFMCGARFIAQTQRAAGRSVRLYRFDQAPARALIPGLGVFHAAEIPFVFGNASGFLGDASSAPALATAMRAYWTRFAGGDLQGTPPWPEWSPASDVRLRLAGSIAVEPANPGGVCDFWTALFNAL